MISAEFRQNVEFGDFDTVRSALIDYLIIDRSFSSFNEALEYAQKTLDIIEPFNNEPPFSGEPWDSNYLNQQKVALMMNFSIERINHIKDVISKVLPANKVEHSPSSASERVGSKTGRRVLSENPIHNQNNMKTRTGNFGGSVPVKPQSVPNGSGKTGKRVVSETVISPNNDEEKGKRHADILSTALIVGGATVTVAGIAVVEPLVIGTGIVVAGAGIGLKVKNGW